MRIALGLEYDGSSYKGWQTQPGGGTVQDVHPKVSLETVFFRTIAALPDDHA